MSSTFSVLSVDARACKGWCSRVKKHGAVIRIMVLLCLVSGAVRGEIKHVCLERSMARVQTAKLFTQQHIGISTKNTCRPWGNVRMQASCIQNPHWRMLGTYVSLQIGLRVEMHTYTFNITRNNWELQRAPPTVSRWMIFRDLTEFFPLFVSTPWALPWSINTGRGWWCENWLR